MTNGIQIMPVTIDNMLHNAALSLHFLAPSKSPRLYFVVTFALYTMAMMPKIWQQSNVVAIAQPRYVGGHGSSGTGDADCR